MKTFKMKTFFFLSSSLGVYLCSLMGGLASCSTSAGQQREQDYHTPSCSEFSGRMSRDTSCHLFKTGCSNKASLRTVLPHCSWSTRLVCTLERPLCLWSSAWLVFSAMLMSCVVSKSNNGHRDDVNDPRGLTGSGKAGCHYITDLKGYVSLTDKIEF